MSTISLNDFNKIFLSRHDFNSSDISVLESKFQNIKFEDIPEAWIILIDKMLSSYSDSFISVSQKYGFLVTRLNNDAPVSLKNRIKKYEKKLYEIDKDLHDLLSAKVVFSNYN